MPDYVEFIKNGPGDVPKQIRDSEAVRRFGDTMTGPLDMGNFKITNLAEPVNNTDATNKGYVDNAVSKSVFTGDMAKKNITNLAEPMNDTDATTKNYVDNVARRWGLIGSWTYQGSLTADFTAYDELIFVCDFADDGYYERGGATIHIPTICFGANSGTMYFSVAMGLSARFMIKLTTTSVSTYDVYYSSGSVTNYRIYCYGR